MSVGKKISIDFQTEISVTKGTNIGNQMIDFSDRIRLETKNSDRIPSECRLEFKIFDRTRLQFLPGLRIMTETSPNFRQNSVPKKNIKPHAILQT